MPEKGIAGILEFGKEEVKFPVEAINKLTTEEAIGTLLYEVDRSLKPTIISNLLNRGFKKIDIRNIRSYLTSKRFKLQKYVIKEEEGYRLTGQGKTWVEKEVIPKLKTEQPSDDLQT